MLRFHGDSLRTLAITLLVGMLAAGCAASSPSSSEPDKDQARPVENAGGEESLMGPGSKDSNGRNSDSGAALTMAATPLPLPTDTPHPTPVPTPESAVRSLSVFEGGRVVATVTVTDIDPNLTPTPTPRTIWAVTRFTDGSPVVEGQVARGKSFMGGAQQIFALHCTGNQPDWAVHSGFPMTLTASPIQEYYVDGSTVLQTEFVWTGKNNPTSIQTRPEIAEKTARSFLKAEREFGMSFSGHTLYWDNPARLRELAQEVLPCVP